MATRQQLVARPRLLDRLDEGRSLTLLRAPTGFGKTTLVRQWVDQRVADDALLASVRVRPGEGDSASFWIAVVESLIDAGLTAPALLLARSPQSSAARMITTATRPLVLWIDSFENVTTAADEVLVDLARHVDDFQLVAAVRSNRHFGEHLINELDPMVLGPTDLLFTADETTAAVRAAGLELPAESMAAIHQGSGGWPELVRTYLLALRNHAPDDLDVNTIMDQVLPDWLRRRLLPDVGRAEVTEFAVVSALPEELTFEVADLLTDDPEAKARLEGLISDGALMPSLGGDGVVSFQWPDTARRALLTELRRRYPERIPVLHERLARWYADRGDPAKGLHHAVAAGAWELVAEIIDEHWRRLVIFHRSELNEALLAAPLEAITRGTTLRPARAVRALMLRHLDPAISVDALPEGAEALADLGMAHDAAATINTGLAVLGALRTPARLAEAAVFAGRLTRVANAARADHPGEVADLYPSVHLCAGEVYLSADDLQTGIQHLEEAYQHAGDSSLGNLEADAAGKLAVAFAFAGDLPRASEWLTRYERAPMLKTWLTPYTRSTTNVARLFIAVDTLDVWRATGIAYDLLGNVLPDTRWARELYAQALLAVHTGTITMVLEQIDRARRRPLAIPAPAEPLVAAVEADLLMAMGLGNQARAILRGAYRDHPWLRVGQARLALLVGDPAGALRLATDADWIRRSRQRQRQEMLLIRAVAAHRLGEATLARTSLQTAAAAAVATGAVRPFTTVPRDDLAAIAADLPAAAEVLDRASVSRSPEVFGRPISLIELTPREHEVLLRIASGLSIRQVAVDLHVAYSTVRTQQRSLYRKLSVESQEDAVARARQAGLLTRPSPTS
jgi:LuxR family maltose regulon positive regulatory protein